MGRYFLRGIVGLGVFIAALAWAADRRVIVINHTSHNLVQFYASNTGRGTWEEDILGNKYIAPGSYARINIDDGSGYCRYDLKAVFANGGTIIRARVNVCEVETWTFEDAQGVGSWR